MKKTLRCVDAAAGSDVVRYMHGRILSTYVRAFMVIVC